MKIRFPVGIVFALMIMFFTMFVIVFTDGCASLQETPGLATGKRFQFINDTKVDVYYQIHCIDHPYKHDGKIRVMKGVLCSGEYFDVTVDYGFGRYMVALQMGKEEFEIPIRASKIVEKIFISDPKRHKELSIEDKLDQFKKHEKEQKKKKIFLRGFKTKS